MRALILAVVLGTAAISRTDRMAGTASAAVEAARAVGSARSNAMTGRVRWRHGLFGKKLSKPTFSFVVLPSLAFPEDEYAESQSLELLRPCRVSFLISG